MAQHQHGQTGCSSVLRSIGFPVLSASLVAAALVSGCGSSSLPAGAATGSGGATVSGDMPTAKWAKRITGYLPARDGTLLKYSVLLPAASGKFPTIINYSGYDAGSIGGSEYQAGDTTMSAELDSRLLGAGYAVMGVNMAGTGCSEGVFDLFAPRWGTDGYDAIEWAAQQDWSNGNIGMANWSYAGLSQVLTAITRPPHLRAIAPGMSVTDPWRDVGYPGGVTNIGFPATWWVYIQQRWTAALQSAISEGDTKCIADIALNEVDSQANSPPLMLAQYHYPEGTKDDQPGGEPVADRLAWMHVNRINVPVLSMMAWQDEATGPRTGYYQDWLNPDTTYVLGTNGRHDSYESKFFHAYLLQFLNRYVKGLENGLESAPHVHLWYDTFDPGPSASDTDPYAEIQPREVIDVDRFPVPVTSTTFALRTGGRLSTEPANAGEAPDSYVYPVLGPSVNAEDDPASVNFNPWQTSTPSSFGSVSYTTPPLSDAMIFYGPGSANLWVSATSVDADLQVTLTEVRPDGQEEYVQRGWLRLSDRRQDTTWSTPLRPFQVFTSKAAQFLSPGVPVQGRLEINRFSHIFRKGSSIRIWVDAPSETGEWIFVPSPVPATVSIYHNDTYPSQLVLGLLQQGGIVSALPHCGSNIYQPCRANPVAVPADK